MATQIDVAIGQFTGFHHGRWNRDDAIGLVTSMGLSKKEWLKIRDDIDTYLTEGEIKEVNEYFKI